MEKEEDAKKATNHEVFFDDKFPIEKRAAATEILIKAKVVTESLRNMVNISGISVITIILQKIVSIFTSRANMKQLDMKFEYKTTCKNDITKHKQAKYE